MISLWLLLSLLLAGTSNGLVIDIICPEQGYELREDTGFCYSYKQTGQDFFAANRSCVREGAILLSIDTQTEDQFIHRRFFNESGRVEFWIGLNDLLQEGVFRWENSSALPAYTNWQTGSPVGNTRTLHCVKFTGDGWAIHSSPCSTASLPYVCKMHSCSSSNGEHCIGEEPTTPPNGVPGWVLAVIIVVVLVIIVAIVVVVLLVLLWKFNNPAFNRYCCCCLSGGAPSNVHSLQQENQRLRHELSQHKLSTSGRYSQGQFARELSGVPDGRGGVLPTIKAPLVSPSIPEDQPLTFGGSPPPLVPQRVSTTRVMPIRAMPLSGTMAPPPPGVFTGGSSLRRQSAPVVISGLGQPANQSKPPLTFPISTKIEEEKKEREEGGVSSSSSEDEDEGSEHSAPHNKTDKGATE